MTTEYNRYQADPNFRLTVDINPPAGRPNIALFTYDHDSAIFSVHISRDQLKSLREMLVQACDDLYLQETAEDTTTAPTEAEMNKMAEEAGETE